MRISISILFCLLLSFCNTDNHEKNSPDSLSHQANAEVDTSTTKSAQEIVNGCYMLILKRDTMVLHLTNTKGELSGKLTFDNYEKDGSTGIVIGRKDGDKLKLVYSFSSEGMNSVMDVYFKFRGEDLLRGVGDVQTKGDTAYFTNPSQVNFPEQDVFKKTACDAIPSKYKL